jgi:hypothetical protein
VRAEPQHRNERERGEADEHAHEQAKAIARTPGREHEKRQDQPCRRLHPDRSDERAARESIMRRRGSRVARVDGACRTRRARNAHGPSRVARVDGACRTRRARNAHGPSRVARVDGACRTRRRQSQRERQQQHRQRVVVVAADGQLQQHRVQAHERDGGAARAAHAPRGEAHQRDRTEARQRGEHLQGPKFARESQRREGVGGEREQWPVGGVLVGPAEEVVDRVGGNLSGEHGVGVKAVQRAQVREADVAEHVLGDQRRAEQQQRVGHEDRQRQRPQRQRARTQQHRHIAPGHHQRERLKARRVDAQAEALEGPGQPVRPATAARGYIQRGGVRGAGGHAEHAGEHGEQAKRAKDTR